METSVKKTKFTVITSTFNAGQSLAATARSLRDQTYTQFEWIIIDGASKDDTVEVAWSFGSLVTVLVSEPDSGIYDAWNKALSLITGDWVLFLGAGDQLFDRNTLAEISALLARLPSGISLAYGSVVEVDQAGRDVRLRDEIWQGIEGPWIVARPLLPCHQGVLHRASLFTGRFRFDTRCKISADNEILLRELMAGHGEQIPITVSRFSMGGVSYDRRNRLRMIAECIYINSKVGIFQKRPIYQLAVLMSNAIKHPLRLLGFTSL